MDNFKSAEDEKLFQAINVAVRKTLATVGLQRFKQTSMFMSAHKRLKLKQAA